MHTEEDPLGTDLRQALQTASRRLSRISVPLLALLLVVVLLPVHQDDTPLSMILEHGGGSHDWVRWLVGAPFPATFGLLVATLANGRGEPRFLPTFLAGLTVSGGLASSVGLLVAFVIDVMGRQNPGPEGYVLLAVSLVGLCIGAVALLLTIAGRWARWAALLLAWWASTLSAVITLGTLEDALKGHFTAGGAVWWGVLLLWPACAAALFATSLVPALWGLRKRSAS